MYLPVLPVCLIPARARGKMVSGEPQRMPHQLFTNRFKTVVAELAGNFVSFQTTEKKGTIRILKKKVIYSKGKRSYYEVLINPASNCDQERIPNTRKVFGTGITLPGLSKVSQAVAGPCRLQLCAVSEGSDISKTGCCGNFIQLNHIILVYRLQFPWQKFPNIMN